MDKILNLKKSVVLFDEEDFKGSYNNFLYKEMIKFLVEDHEDDEQVIKFLIEQRNERNCVENYVEKVVYNYNYNEFKTHFRLSVNTFSKLCKRYEQHHLFQDLRYDKRYPPDKHMLVFLWFSAHEACSFRDIADRFDLSLSTVSLIIARVSRFISSMSDEVIMWPNKERKQEISAYFQMKTGFPNVIGNLFIICL